MNVSAVSSTQTLQTGNVSGNGPEIELSDEQKELVSSVLEGYDSDSLSQEDAIEIASAFADAGITPSRDLANTMASSGFSAHEVGELAGVAGASGMPPPPPGGMPPPPQDSQEEENSISSLLETLLNDDEDENSESSSLYQSVSDYTSRIINLNNDVKQQVKELFESYSPQNTDLSRDDASKVVVNSLSQILSDSDNYKKTSFYG